MSLLQSGKTFENGEQLTAGKLNAIVGSATISTSGVDGSTIIVNTNDALAVRSGGVGTVQLQNYDSNATGDTGVTEAKLAPDCVTTSKILDDAVTTAKILDDNVTTAKILDANVTKAKIEDISDYKVLGNVSGAASAPAEVAILDENDMSSDSDTALATQKSIKAYVDSTSGGGGSLAIPYATFTDASGSTFSSGAFGAYTEVDPSGIASVSGSTITLTSGTFLVSWNGSFSYQGGDFYTITARYGSNVVQELYLNNRTGSIDRFLPFSASTVVTSAGSQTLSLYAQRNSSTQNVYFENLNITVTKIG